MSFQQLLQSYSQDITAKDNQANEANEENVDRKASTLQEQMEHHLEAINSASQDLIGASGAYHLGRKIYNKYKGKRADALEKAQKAKAEATDPNKPSGEAGETSKPTGDGNADPVSNAGGGRSAENPRAGDFNESSASGDPVRPEPTLDQKVDDVQARFRALKERVSQPVEPEAREPVPASEASNTSNIGVPKRDMPDKAFGKTAERFQNRSNQIEAQANPVRGETAPDRPDEAPNRNTTVRETNIDEPQSFRNVVPGESDPFSAPRSLGQTSVENDLSRDVGSGLRGGLEEAGANSQRLVGGVGDGVGNIVNQVKNKVASKVGEGLGDDMGSMLTADSVLDAIPVVGEIAGVVTGIMGLVDGLKGDPAANRNKIAGSAVGALSRGSAGLDATALTQEGASAKATMV